MSPNIYKIQNNIQMRKVKDFINFNFNSLMNKIYKKK
jgi:hypothetical protein